jgi:hypothetical protein
MTPLNRIVIAALAVGVFASGASAARAAAPPPTGDAAGIELAQKVNAYYSAEPRMGVASRVTVEGITVVSRMLLVRGKVRAVIGNAGFGPLRVTTAMTSRGFFMRVPGERCWTKVNSAQGPEQSMINLRGSRFLAPESIGALTRLEVVERVSGSGARMRVAYKIDPETGRIATMINDGIVANFRTLPAAPVIPSLRPVCKA